MLIRFLQALCLIIYVILPQCYSQNVGSVFFNQQRFLRWDDTEEARLRARRVFENFLPKIVSPNEVNSEYVRATMQYFKAALRKVKDTETDSKPILTEVLADIIGGYIRAEMLPNVRYAYYAGTLNYDDVNVVNNAYEEVKEYLNTQGIGWARPKKLRRDYGFNVERIEINPSGRDPCSKLIVRRDTNDCIKVPLPKLDEKNEPSSIAIPWRKNTLLGLYSRRSTHILIRYYRTAAECILKESPLSCRRTAFSKFNTNLCQWIKREVVPHLEEEKWYVGFGGVLRVGATIQSHCSADDESGYNSPTDDELSFEEYRPPERHKDEMFQNPNTMLLVQLVVALAACIWLFTSIITCYYRSRKASKAPSDKHTEARFIAAPARTNSCKIEMERTCIQTRRSRSTPPPETMHPVDVSQVDAVPVNLSLVKTPVNTALVKQATSLNAGPSHSRSVKTERVFDLNEQKMKEMPVPHYTEQAEELASTSRSSTASSELTSGCRSGPPCLETSISQLQVKKTSRCPAEQSQLAVYTTSEGTSAATSRSEAQSSQTLKCVMPAESLSSSVWTSSSTGGGSSLDSQGRARRAVARIAKDLAWAKRMGRRRRQDEAGSKASSKAK